MSDKNKKIIICAGGTGGHVFPAKKLSEMLLKETVEIIQENKIINRLYKLNSNLINRSLGLYVIQLMDLDHS